MEDLEEYEDKMKALIGGTYGELYNISGSSGGSYDSEEYDNSFEGTLVEDGIALNGTNISKKIRVTVPLSGHSLKPNISKEEFEQKLRDMVQLENDMQAKIEKTYLNSKWKKVRAAFKMKNLMRKLTEAAGGNGTGGSGGGTG